MMFAAAMAGVLAAMALTLVRGLLGPTVFDRVLALNTFGTVTVLAIAVLGFLMGRPQFLDIALLYALINFVSTIAILKYLQYGDLGVSGRTSDTGDSDSDTGSNTGSNTGGGGGRP